MMKELLIAFGKALLAIAIFVLCIFLFSECGVKKNIDTKIVTYDSTQTISQKTEIDYARQTVDTTSYTEEEVTTKTTTFFEPIIVDGVLIAGQVQSIKEETHRRKTEQKGEATNTEIAQQTAQTDSTSVATADNQQIVTNVDTKAGTKRFFLAFSFLIGLAIVVGIGYLLYLKFIR